MLSYLFSAIVWRFLPSAQCRPSAGEERMEPPSEGKWTWIKPVESWRSRISKWRTPECTNVWPRTAEGGTQWKESCLFTVSGKRVFFFFFYLGFDRKITIVQTFFVLPYIDPWVGLEGMGGGRHLRRGSWSAQSQCYIRKVEYCEHQCVRQLFQYNPTHGITKRATNINLACTLTAASLLTVSMPAATIKHRFTSPFIEMWFFFTPSPTIVLPEQLMAPDEEVLWFLSPLFRHLCIDDVCSQGPGGLRLTEIIKSKCVSPWRGDVCLIC